MNKIRPYWHVDAKWITGIICFFLLSAFLVNLSLYVVTTKKIAVPLLGKGIAFMYSRNGLDDETEIQKFREKIKAAPGGRIEAIPNSGIFVTLADTENKTPRELRYWIFDKVAEPIWDQKGVDKPLNKYGVLAFVSSKTNQLLFRALLILGISLIIFASLFILFSARFGKLFGPGLIIFSAALAPSIIWGVIASAPNTIKIDKIPFIPEGGGQMAESFNGVFQLILPDLSSIIFKIYITSVGIGILLMIAAGIGRAFFRNKKDDDKKDKDSTK